MRARFEKLGSVGLNTDIAPTLLPPGAWTSLYNISTEDGSIRSAYGDRKLFDLEIRPKYQFGFMDNTVQKVIVSDGLVVHSYAMDGSHEDISPTPALVEGIVSFTTLNGILVVNSEHSGPYYWAGFGTNLVALPGWDTNWKCKQIVGFHNVLVALNMTESSATYQHKIRWSNSADPGAIPTIWVAAPENDAGDAIIGETSGIIVSGILLRDFLAVVKEDAIYSMRYIGGTYVMQLERMSGSVGTRVLKGVAVGNSALAIFTIGDLLLYDGQNTTSLVESRIRRGIAQSVSEDYWKNCALFSFNTASLLILGLIGAGYTRMNAALIYNSDDGTWSHRALTGAYGFGQIQVTVEPGLTWDSLDDTGVIWIAPGDTWDSKVGAGWDKGLYHPSTDDFIAYLSNDADTAWWVTAISAFETSSDGEPKNCVATRTGIPIAGADKLVMITRIWPEFISSIPTDVWVGGQMTSDGDITWQGPFTSTPGETFSVTPRLTCRFLSVRIESNSIGHWRLPAMTVDYETAGER
jgi:hypothetical protein